MKRNMAKKKRDFLTAYKNTMGNISISCEKVGISRRTYYDYIKNDPDFVEQVEDLNERNLDFAESQLLKQIKDDNTTSLIFYLKTKGKGRGYIERTEIQNEIIEDKNEETEEELMSKLDQILKKINE
jgi:hypothetical protein